MLELLAQAAEGMAETRVAEVTRVTGLGAVLYLGIRRPARQRELGR